MHISRDLVTQCVDSNGINYDMIVGEMERLYTPECKRGNPTRSMSFEAIVQELRDCEGEVTERASCEKARRLALVIDGFSMLAHIHSELQNPQEQISLRYQKDRFMLMLSEHCKNSGIYAGIGFDSSGKDTFEVDIPYVGHVGWHFGRKADVYDKMRSTGIGYYKYDIEPKVDKDGREYTNADLLKRDLSLKRMNDVDANLAMYGSRTPRPTKDI